MATSLYRVHLVPVFVADKLKFYAFNLLPILHGFSIFRSRCKDERDSIKSISLTP
jgi:hypothetical protein